MKKIASNADFQSGLLFVGLGGAFLLLSFDYDYGTAREMGPGYFPRLLSLGVIAIGAIQIAKGLRQAAENAQDALRIHLRPAFFVLGAMAVFALLLRPAGLILATMAAVVIAGSVAPDRRAREIVLAAVGLAAFAAFVFVEGLGVNMPLWPRGF